MLNSFIEVQRELDTLRGKIDKLSKQPTTNTSVDLSSVKADIAELQKAIDKLNTPTTSAPTEYVLDSLYGVVVGIG